MDPEFYAIVIRDNVSLFYWGAFGKKDMLSRVFDATERGAEVMEIFECPGYPQAERSAEGYIRRQGSIPSRKHSFF